MVYPNPANGVLHLTYPTTELPKRIVINDVLGNKVSEVLPSFGGVGGGSEIVLPLSIANGVYSLSIYYENNAFQSTKFVLLR